MKSYIVADEWKIIEQDFNNQVNEISESLCSIGNGHMGQRANFEEDFSGHSLQGSYVGGVYYPDKTKVGWWKNGYPEYFAKVLNSVNWIGLRIWVNGENLDLNKVKEIRSFQRELDMMNGILARNFHCVLHNNAEIKIEAKRFVSMAESELGVLQYNIQSINFEGTIEVESYLDFDIINKDSNYDEKFWEPVSQHASEGTMGVVAETKKTKFIVSALAQTKIKHNGLHQEAHTESGAREKYASQMFSIQVEPGHEIQIQKYVVIASSLNHHVVNLLTHSKSLLDRSVFKGFEQLENEHSAKWHKIWTDCDIIIEGDVKAQQGIRFNIFQLYSTYDGKDSRLNIGPKGFTGEKYGGSTYWDTEAYCLPFYMATTEADVARNLLVYRYNQLDKAIENAQKLGFKNGAALYPMVTMNGEECHNEWEITFEEIHRNGAIAYAIYDYINYTGDTTYIAEKGLEVLIGIARFWAQRINYSKAREKYVMLGVTGPNEYENNVNNNWYTNYIAVWCMKYTQQCIEELKLQNQETWKTIAAKVKFNEGELTTWSSICNNMYFPEDSELGIFLQQDGYMDKEQITVSELPASDRPLNQKWSWDRILRSCFIKQADVLQGLYFFEDDFSMESHRNNFYFYEPRTVHESSLSPCVHSILAAKLGDKDKAYEMYLRTSRLDLDNYNNDTEDGLHITSMAGTWLSVIKGFGGLRVRQGKVCLAPFLPEQFSAIRFRIKFRGAMLDVYMKHNQIVVSNHGENQVTIQINGHDYVVSPGEQYTSAE